MPYKTLEGGMIMNVTLSLIVANISIGPRGTYKTGKLKKSRTSNPVKTAGRGSKMSFVILSYYKGKGIKDLKSTSLISKGLFIKNNWVNFLNDIFIYTLEKERKT